MNSSSNGLVKSFYNERPANEIDLLDILGKLLVARKKIIAITLAFALLGMLLTYILPKKWSSQAIVTPPEQAQLTPLRELIASMQALGVDVKGTRTDVFNYFIKEFGSRSLFQNWLLSNPSMLKMLTEKYTTPDEMHRAIVEMAERLDVKNNADPKNLKENLYTSWSLSYTGKDATQAQQVLEEYTKYVDKKVQNELMDVLKSQLQYKIKLEEDKLALAKEDLINDRDAKIQRLKYALNIANAAGIKQPVFGKGQTVKDDPDYAITLGADGIAAKLEIEKSLTDVSSISANIRNREYRLTRLKHLAIPDTEFMSFKFLLTPSLPVKNDNSSSVLIILLFTSLGFMFASFSVLVFQSLATRKS
jgi:LPS O-antigen subunit length determinant protein (WzzB/FepE family)